MKYGIKLILLFVLMPALLYIIPFIPFILWGLRDNDFKFSQEIRVSLNFPSPLNDYFVLVPLLLTIIPWFVLFRVLHTGCGRKNGCLIFSKTIFIGDKQRAKKLFALFLAFSFCFVLGLRWEDILLNIKEDLANAFKLYQVCLFAPVVEELYYRVYFFKRYRQDFASRSSSICLVNALLFSLSHVFVHPPISIIVIFILSFFLLSKVYAATESFLLVFLIHSLWNFIVHFISWDNFVFKSDFFSAAYWLILIVLIVIFLVYVFKLHADKDEELV